MNLCTSTNPKTSTPTKSYSLSAKTVAGAVGTVAVALCTYAGWTLYTNRKAKKAELATLRRQLNAIQATLEETTGKLAEAEQKLTEKNTERRTVTFAARNLLNTVPTEEDSED